MGPTLVLPMLPPGRGVEPGRPATPEKNVKGTSHFNHTWTLLPRGDLTLHAVPTTENGSRNPATFSPHFPKGLFSCNFPPRFSHPPCYFLVGVVATFFCTAMVSASPIASHEVFLDLSQ